MESELFYSYYLRSLETLIDTPEGARVYQAVADWAHNNDYIFIGDPAGLSPVAQIRRTEQMMSSALKWGTARHLAPHAFQR